jgi:hypothetical protein
MEIVCISQLQTLRQFKERRQALTGGEMHGYARLYSDDLQRRRYVALVWITLVSLALIIAATIVLPITAEKTKTSITLSSSTSNALSTSSVSTTAASTSTTTASTSAYAASTSTTTRGSSTLATTSGGASTSAAASTSATTGFDPPSLGVYVDAVNGNDANSGRSIGSPVQTITQALAIVSNEGYQTSCTIHLAAGTYPTPNGTLFNGTPIGTHTGPIVISGATNSTALWCSTVASAPTVSPPNPLYSFAVNGSILSGSELCYYCGLTIAFSSGLDAGVSYTLAGANTTNTSFFNLAYDAIQGAAPLFGVNDAFCIYTEPESILAVSDIDNALWLSTNGFAYTLQNVQIQAFSGGTGRLQWQGLNWTLQNVWLTGEYSSGGINLTASAGCVLSAGLAAGVRQGIRLALPSTSNFANTTVDAMQSILAVSGSTATLDNSVFRAGSVQTSGGAAVSLGASLLWGNAALSATDATTSLLSSGLYITARDDVNTSSYSFALSVLNNASIAATQCYWLFACTTGCASPLMSVGADGALALAMSTVFVPLGATATVVAVSGLGGQANLTSCAMTVGSSTTVSLTGAGGTVLLTNTSLVSSLTATSGTLAAMLSQTAGVWQMSSSTVDGGGSTRDGILCNGGTLNVVASSALSNFQGRPVHCSSGSPVININGGSTLTVLNHFGSSIGISTTGTCSAAISVTNVIIAVGTSATGIGLASGASATVVNTTLIANSDANPLLTLTSSSAIFTGYGVTFNAQGTNSRGISGGSGTISISNSLFTGFTGGNSPMVQNNSPLVTNIYDSTFNAGTTCQAIVIISGTVNVVNTTFAGSTSTFPLQLQGGTLHMTGGTATSLSSSFPTVSATGGTLIADSVIFSVGGISLTPSGAVIVANVSNLSSPPGQPVGSYGITAVGSTHSTTINEKTGSNTLFLGTSGDVSLCGSANTWTTVLPLLLLLLLIWMMMIFTDRWLRSKRHHRVELPHHSNLVDF